MAVNNCRNAVVYDTPLPPSTPPWVCSIEKWHPAHRSSEEGMDMGWRSEAPAFEIPCEDL